MSTDKKMSEEEEEEEETKPEETTKPSRATRASTNKRHKKSSSSTGSSNKRTRGAKKTKTQKQKKPKRSAAKTQEPTSESTSTSADEAPLSTFRRLRSGNKAASSEEPSTSGTQVTHTESALNSNAPVGTCTQIPPMEEAGCSTSVPAATAACTFEAAQAATDNDQGSDVRQYLDLTSTGVPFVITVQKGLFPTTSAESSNQEGVNETTATVPLLVPSTEMAGGNQRCFLPSTADGVPLPVSVQNATSGGQVLRRHAMPEGEASTSREGIVTIEPPMPVDPPAPIAPRLALSEMILQGREYDEEDQEVVVGPPWVRFTIY